jgi:hypothetical protein
MALFCEGLTSRNFASKEQLVPSNTVVQKAKDSQTITKEGVLFTHDCA